MRDNVSSLCHFVKNPPPHRVPSAKTRTSFLSGFPTTTNTVRKLKLWNERLMQDFWQQWEDSHSLTLVTAPISIFYVCMFIGTIQVIWAKTSKCRLSLICVITIYVRYLFLRQTLYHKEESSTKTFQMLTHNLSSHTTQCSMVITTKPNDIMQ